MTIGRGRDNRFRRVLSSAEDTSVVLRVRYVNAFGLDGSTAITAATVDSDNGNDLLQFQANAANDTGINGYTGASGTAGQVVYTDANANTVQELVDIINGVGTGQTAFRRWRAAIADFPALYTLTGGDILDSSGFQNCLLGLHNEGRNLFADSSALAGNDDVWLGIGTEGGVRNGVGLVVPDYFEDRPGTSGITGFSTNTPDRSRQVAKQNDFVSVVRYSVQIEGINANIGYTGNDTRVRVWTNEQNPSSDTPFYDITLGDVAAASDRRGVVEGITADTPLIGPPGVPLFVQVSGGSGFAAGEDTSLAVFGRYV